MGFIIPKFATGPREAEFDSELVVTPVPTKGWFKRQNWRLFRLLAYIAEDGTKYVLPEGFITDLASIPWIFYPILRPAGAFGIMYAPAAVLHDYLLRNKHTHSLTNKQIHKLFEEALISCGMSKWLARIYYTAVKIVNP